MASIVPGRAPGSPRRFAAWGQPKEEEAEQGAKRAPVAGSVYCARASRARRGDRILRQWLERQLNDPYVAAAKREGIRSRAAYKLMEIDDKYRVLKPGMRVVDLGAAPGGWSQIAAERVKSVEGAGPKRGQVIAIDYLGMEPLAGVEMLELDFTRRRGGGTLKSMLPGAAPTSFFPIWPRRPWAMPRRITSASWDWPKRPRISPAMYSSRRAHFVQGFAGRHRARAARYSEAIVCGRASRQAAGEPRPIR